jgi:hypothetical protein
MKIKAFEVEMVIAFFFCLLMLSPAGATSYTLTVSDQGSGAVTKNPTNAIYPSGVTVTITATPNVGWYFGNWSGDTNGSVNPLNVTMNSNLVITGNFLAFPTYSLTIITNGQGTIGLNPPGGSYLSNSIVKATAMPANGWVFTSWSGSTNTSFNPLSLTLNTSLTLTGNFAQMPAFDIMPASVTNGVDSTVNFFSHAVGNTPLSYQWFFNNGSLTNATNSTLALTNVTAGQVGNYWVIATNNYGSATSSVVALVLTNIPGSTNVVNSPDEGSLRAAINLGGWVSVDFNGTLTLTNTIDVTNNVSLDAENVTAIISGRNVVRLFYVAPGVTFSATNLILANGSCIVTNGAAGTQADGGAIYNDGGIVSLVTCTLTNNSAQSLVISNGLARGGAIYNNGGSVSLFGSSLSNNEVVGGVYYGGALIDYSITVGGFGLGGAIFNTNGSFNIVNCIINSNSSTSAGMPWVTSSSYGGALFQTSGSLTISNSLFDSNLALGNNAGFIGTQGYSSQSAYGGALAETAGSVVVKSSRFSGNTAQGGSYGYNNGNGLALGGAIYSTATLTAVYTTFLKNQAKCGVDQVGIANGTGGAIYNLGTTAFNSCSIYSNFAEGGSAINDDVLSKNGGSGLGGGIFNASQLAATNCTIALNVAVSGSGSLGTSDGYPPAGVNGNALGGGVFNNSSAMFTALNVTIASNYCIAGGAGFSGSNGVAAGTQVANTNGTLALHNSIIAYGGTNSNAYGPITDDGFNICSDGSANLKSGASYNFTDPQLAPLANYGGPTLCMALLPNSPAIDTADSLDFPVTDQRGFVRPIGDGPDMGAYEYGSYQPGALYLNITSVADNILLSFTAAPVNVYLLQTSTNLSTWSDLNTNGPFSSATNISQTISQQGFNARFFRLLVQ